LAPTATERPRTSDPTAAHQGRGRRRGAPDRRLWIAWRRTASGTRSAECTPRAPDEIPRQHSEEHFGRVPVEISLISAVRTHARCVHM